MSARFGKGQPRMRAAVAAFFFAAALSISARAAAQAGPAQSSHEVTDETGRVVKIPQPVRRIVSLAPSLTEALYALGLQDRLVGDTDYCDYPLDAAKKRKVGGAINPNMEEVVALKPDVVLVVKSLNRLETVRALEQIGIPVYATDPHTVSEVIRSMKRLSEVLGAEGTGIALDEKLQSKLATIHEKLNGAPVKRVMFVVWTEPLISVGRKTFIAD